MEEMSHAPAAVDIATQVSDNALRGATAGATALTSVTELVPAGADEVSAQAATAFTSEGFQLLASNASAQDELHRAGEAVQDVARTYSQIDDGAAGVFA
ncbi:PE family protein [Mycobacterium decipiens]|uniref:PE family protein n=1 Tax=Mycobacterium decipiens TaxID=1430326 RepID=A0A1X2LM99_9MYCO|nr:PE family protein [Mycobacterium decipiens]OSC35506.1 PE family protein [Mycobacterium decipiens]